MSNPRFDVWRRELARPASRAILERPRPDDLLGSRLGRVRVALPGEEWPMWRGGLMVPVAQINLTELPLKPRALEDTAMITVFVAWNEEDDGEPYLPSDSPNGEGWLLRAYRSLEGLEPLSGGDEGVFDERSIRWEALERDYPSLDDKPLEHDGDPLEWQEKFPCHDGTKVGGWPATIQGEIYWAPWNKHPANPEYVFQIDNEPDIGLMWGDCGTAYFGRGTGASRDVWTSEWQCC